MGETPPRAPGTPGRTSAPARRDSLVTTTSLPRITPETRPPGVGSWTLSQVRFVEDEVAPDQPLDVEPGWCTTCGTQISSDICPVCLTDATVPVARLILPGGAWVPMHRDSPVLLGRESDVREVAVTLAGQPTVSRRHAEVMVTGGMVVLQDLGSTNQTFVDSRPIGREPVELSLPARFRLGCHVEIEVH